MDESCSELHKDHEFATRLKVGVKNFKKQSERKIGGKWKILDLKFCYEQNQLGFGLYTPC